MADGEHVGFVEPVASEVSRATGKPSYVAVCACGWRATISRMKRASAMSDLIEHTNGVRPVLREAQSRPSAREFRNPVNRPHGGGGSAA